MKCVFGDCGVRTKSHQMEPHPACRHFCSRFKCQFGTPTVRYTRGGGRRRAERAIPPMPSFPADSARPEQDGTWQRRPSTTLIANVCPGFIDDTPSLVFRVSQTHFCKLPRNGYDPVRKHI